ncbi:MAG: YidC/Oxa1 family membrane protein insertase [Oscillospiraceae bacterium]|jgi:YidC/Oxa1 family membrane protein insertase|nr:YidC/Oxa1 family membrane protein insertase [Oscillospiraceae bacterium]
MLDFITIPFKYLLLGLNSLCHNYGVAILLFAFVVQAILTPFGAKSKKSMLKMSRLAPKIKELEKRYGSNKQKYQQESAKLYSDEGVKTLGGCLWSIIPLPIMMALYRYIVQPFTKLWSIPDGYYKALRDLYLKPIGDVSGALTNNNVYYDQIRFAELFHNNFDAVMERIRESGTLMAQELAKLFDSFKASDMNFNFLGLNLASTPNWKVWEWETINWQYAGLFLLPVISVAVSILTMMVSQKLQGGDREQQKQGRTMMLMMPLISLFIGFSMPGLMSLYWIAGGLLGGIKDVLLTIHYNKVLDSEYEIRDAAKLQRERELEAKKAAAEAKIDSGDFDLSNVSKKKKELQEKIEREKKSREWELSRGMRKEKEVESAQVGDRPFAKGRNYNADRFKGNSESEPEDSLSIGVNEDEIS